MGGKDAIMTGRSGRINAEGDEAFAAFITYSLLMLARKNADFIVFKHYLRAASPHGVNSDSDTPPFVGRDERQRVPSRE